MLTLHGRHTAECNRTQAKKHAKNPKLPKKLSTIDLKPRNCPLMVVGADSPAKFQPRVLAQTQSKRVAPAHRAK
jgi:hypothetical protein